MNEAIDFVAFKLKKSVSEEQFMPVSDNFNSGFLKKQKGYISRRLLKKGDTFADLVLWECEQDHLDAMEASKTDPVAAEYMAHLNLSAKGSFYHLFSTARGYDL